MTAADVRVPRGRRGLRVAETFTGTVQGEGPSTGVPASFIRLSLCNLSCRDCDTPYTWDTSRFDLRRESIWQEADHLVGWALAQPEQLVVVTGGEPLLQPDVLTLVQGLRAGGREVEIETNGTVVPAPELVAAGPWFNVSPKLSGFGEGMPQDRRIVPGALRVLAASGRARWKFVVRTPGELPEIAALESAYGLSPISVMPEGTTAEAVLEGMRVLWGRSRSAGGGSGPGCTFFCGVISVAAEPEPRLRATAGLLLDGGPVRPVVDQEHVAFLYRELLRALGEDPDREGLKDTPARAARWWAEFLEHDPGRTDTLFVHEQAGGDGEEVVIVSGITVESVCEHHLLPMTLDVTAAYCPAGQVLGLSKLARIAQAHGHRLQLQERIVNGIAEDLAKATGVPDVAVAATGTHLCMSMRGVRATGAVTTSVIARGRFTTSEPLSLLFRGIALKGAAS